MQRILSVETSRSADTASEFVTKRLCCSFILTIGFLAIIGGFLLGRFAADQSLEKMKNELSEISKRIAIFNKDSSIGRNSSFALECFRLEKNQIRTICDSIVEMWNRACKLEESL